MLNLHHCAKMAFHAGVYGDSNPRVTPYAQIADDLNQNIKFESKEVQREFIANKRKVAEQELLIKKYEKMIEISKVQEEAQETRCQTLENVVKEAEGLIFALRRKARVATADLREERALLNDIRAALDELVDVDPDGVSCNIVSDLLFLHRSRNIRHVIRMENRIRIRDWIHDASAAMTADAWEEDWESGAEAEPEVPALAPRTRVWPNPGM